MPHKTDSLANQLEPERARYLPFAMRVSTNVLTVTLFEAYKYKPTQNPHARKDVPNNTNGKNIPNIEEEWDVEDEAPSTVHISFAGIRYAT